MYLLFFNRNIIIPKSMEVKMNCVNYSLNTKIRYRVNTYNILKIIFSLEFSTIAFIIFLFLYDEKNI